MNFPIEASILNPFGRAAHRRSFLKFLLAGAVSAAALMISWGIGRFAFFNTAPNVKRELNREVLNKLQVALPLHFPEAGAWVVKADANSPNLTAFDDKCTHLGCRQKWNQDKGLFECPCHGSEFDLEGRVKRGPANRPLTKLSLAPSEENKIRLIEVSADG